MAYNYYQHKAAHVSINSRPSEDADLKGMQAVHKKVATRSQRLTFSIVNSVLVEKDAALLILGT